MKILRKNNQIKKEVDPQSLSKRLKEILDLEEDQEKVLIHSLYLWMKRLSLNQILLQLNYL